MSPGHDTCNDEALRGREFLDIDQVAQRYGISVATVRRNAANGVMPGGLRIGHARRWKLTGSGGLEEWEAGGCKPIR